GHSARNKAGLKVRQPLAELRIESRDADLASRVKPFIPLVLDELNVKAVTFVDSGTDLYELAIRLDAKTARPKYGRYFNELQQTLASMPAPEVEQRLKRKEPVALRLGDEAFDLLPEEIVAEKIARDGWAVSDGDGFTVAVCTKLDSRLIQE